jgi:hypothetical protein
MRANTLNMLPVFNIIYCLGYIRSYYRKLVPKFAQIAKSLSQLTQKDAKFQWKTEGRRAFENMKENLSMSPVLVYPDFRPSFILTTDESKVAVAAALSQVQEV